MGIVKEKNDRKDIRKFGLTVGFVFLLAGLTLSFLGRAYYNYFLYIGVYFIFFGVYFQSILRPVYFVWMKVSLLIGWFMTRVILVLLYYLVVTPISLIRRFLGKGPLDIRFDKSKESYWDKRSDDLGDEYFKKQY